MKKCYLMLIILSIILSCKSEKRIDFIKKINIEFSGIVSSITKIDHGFGLVCIDLINKTNIEYNSELDGYFICKVRNNKAKLVININSVQKGDSIVFNPNNNKSYLNFRKGKLIFESKIIFSSHSWKYLNEESKKINCIE